MSSDSPSARPHTITRFRPVRHRRLGMATRQVAMRRLQEMQEHHASSTAGGRLRAAVFGANDGLVTNVSLVVGVAAADPGRDIVILAGVAGLVAGAFSMAAGEYISMKIQQEVYEAQIAQERRELAENPEVEHEEVRVIFQAKGLPAEDSARIADHIMADPEVALDLMAREELGLNPDDLGSPWGAAVSSFVAFSIGAAVPLLPYILWAGTTALLGALLLAGVMLFIVGAASARLTERPALFGGVRGVMIGAIATGVTYLIGRFVGVAVH